MSSRIAEPSQPRAPAQCLAAAALCVALAVSAPASAAAQTSDREPSADQPAEVRIVAAEVQPRRSYVAGRPVRASFSVRASQRARFAIEVRRRGSDRVLRRWRRVAGERRRRLAVRWDGRRADGGGVRDATFRVRARLPDGSLRPLGSARLMGHAFPIRGSHGARGPVGTFGAGRTGGRSHQGFDVTAACGTPMVAARGGRVVGSGYDPVLYGHFLRIAGRGNSLGYFYSHLQARPAVGSGDRVRTGQRIGRVGDTGNARGTGCHLHFELRRAGRLIDPEPHLRRWSRRQRR